MDALTNHPPLADRLDLQYADLRTDIEKALAGVTTPAVASDDDALLARGLVLPLKSLQDRVEAERKVEKDYFWEGGKTVDAFFKTIRADLDATVAAITKVVNDYQTKKREDARNADAARARIAAAMQEPAPVAAAPAQTARVATSAGVAVSGSVRWDHEIVDASLLPRELLMPNDAAIKAKRDGLKAQGIKIDDAQIPGVRIFEKVGTTFR